MLTIYFIRVNLVGTVQQVLTIYLTSLSIMMNKNSNSTLINIVQFTVTELFKDHT